MPAIPRVDRLKNVYTSAKALNFAFRLTATNPQAVLFNGVTAYRPQIHRLTIHFCRNSESSLGVRNFIEHSLTKFATENASCAIYVMPGRNCTPWLRAEYSNGRVVQVKATHFSMEDMCRHMNNLRTRSGLPIQKFENAQFSHHKSVQGMWTPTIWQKPSNSRETLAKPISPPYFSNKAIGATEYLLRQQQNGVAHHPTASSSSNNNE